NARRTIADDPIEEWPKLADDALDAVLGQRIFVARLRGGKEEQRVDPFVANKRLSELRGPLHDVNQVVDHASFRAHEEVEIAQADVEIDHRDSLASARQSRTKGRGRCCLADAAF